MRAALRRPAGRPRGAGMYPAGDRTGGLCPGAGLFARDGRGGQRVADRNARALPPPPRAEKNAARTTSSGTLPTSRRAIHLLHRGPVGRGGLGRLSKITQQLGGRVQLVGDDPVRHQPCTPLRGHRAAGGQRHPGEAQPRSAPSPRRLWRCRPRSRRDGAASFHTVPVRARTARLPISPWR